MKAVPPGPEGSNALVPTSKIEQPQAHAQAAPGTHATAAAKAIIRNFEMVIRMSGLEARELTTRSRVS